MARLSLYSRLKRGVLIKDYLKIKRSLSNKYGIDIGDELAYMVAHATVYKQITFVRLREQFYSKLEWDDDKRFIEGIIKRAMDRKKQH